MNIIEENGEGNGSGAGAAAASGGLTDKISSKRKRSGNRSYKVKRRSSTRGRTRK